MRIFAWTAVVVTTLVAGLLLGGAVASRDSTQFPETVIRVSDNEAEPGRCTATTDDGTIRARYRAAVVWHVQNSCRFWNGALVQLRFDSGPPPVLPADPIQRGGVVVARTNVRTGVHSYKVWAHFPAGGSEDYVLQDPDIEIVSYTMFSQFSTLFPFGQ